MAYVPDFGHAAEQGQEYRLYRQMYAQLADQWLSNGCFLHGITLYPGECEPAAAWFSLGFGLAVIDALRAIGLSPVSEQLPGDGIEVRCAGVEDVELVAQMERALGRHLSASPVFLPLLQDRRSELESWLSEEGHALWLALRGAEAAGYLQFQPSECLVLPTSAPTTVAITGAYTRTDLRGAGIGTTLLQAGLRWASSVGYTHCSVDFESANLPGSRFWLRNFGPVTHSLVRRIDSRLAWANARRNEEDLRRAYEGHSWIG
jgi:GNAT superfamily N-acetyltransferase